MQKPCAIQDGEFSFAMGTRCALSNGRPKAFPKTLPPPGRRKRPYPAMRRAKARRQLKERGRKAKKPAKTAARAGMAAIPPDHGLANSRLSAGCSIRGNRCPAEFRRQAP